MRIVLFGLFLAIGVIYSTGAVYFYTQERWSHSISEAQAVAPTSLHHPEATLSLIRERMESKDFSPGVRPLVRRGLTQVPSFYQPPVFLAVFHANRLEEMELTYDAFQAAVSRFPVNGRLHLDYSRWLFASRLLLPGISDPEVPGQILDLKQEGENHLRIALALEPDLTQEGLLLLREQDIPPDRWAELVPDDVIARLQLIAMLARDGHREEALALLQPLLKAITDARHCRLAADWALAWGDPGLAIKAVARWRETMSERRQVGIEPHEAGLIEARAHLALGEMDTAYKTFRRTLGEVGPSSNPGLKLLCAMGEQYLRLKRTALAQSVFMEATGYSPTYVPALLGLARTYRRIGNEPKAIEEYRRVLLVDPHNATAERELGQLVIQQRMRGRN